MEDSKQDRIPEGQGYLGSWISTEYIKELLKLNNKWTNSKTIGKIFQETGHQKRYMNGWKAHENIMCSSLIIRIIYSE